MKTCSKCGKKKSKASFYRDAQKSSGFRPDCKTCVNEKSASWSKRNPEKRRIILRRYLYGVSDKEYNVLLKKQHKSCKICKKKDKRRLGIDHDHKTGKVRGLLCQKCNAGLGMFLDNIDSLRAAIKYLGG